MAEGERNIILDNILNVEDNGLYSSAPFSTVATRREDSGFWVALTCIIGYLFIQNLSCHCKCEMLSVSLSWLCKGMETALEVPPLSHGDNRDKQMTDIIISIKKSYLKVLK